MNNPLLSPSEADSVSKNLFNQAIKASKGKDMGPYITYAESVSKTDLINKAKEKNCKIIFGYEMLLGQAIRSFEIWLDRKAPYDVMKRSILGGF